MDPQKILKPRIPTRVAEGFWFEKNGTGNWKIHVPPRATSILAWGIGFLAVGLLIGGFVALFRYPELIQAVVSKK